jgi:prepilin-type processing-associated H-X9-DG protein
MPTYKTYAEQQSDTTERDGWATIAFANMNNPQQCPALQLSQVSDRNNPVSTTAYKSRTWSYGVNAYILDNVTAVPYKSWHGKITWNRAAKTILYGDYATAATTHGATFIRPAITDWDQLGLVNNYPYPADSDCDKNIVRLPAARHPNLKANYTFGDGHVASYGIMKMRFDTSNTAHKAVDDSEGGHPLKWF